MRKVSPCSKLASGGLFLILTLAIGLVGSYEFRPRHRQFVGRVATLLPAVVEAPGWQMIREEIASTPEMKRAVAEHLNFDDAVFATYVRDGHKISIYIAYWLPGKMSQRLIASHTPDTCWVKAGWEVAAATVARNLVGPKSRLVLPAEERHMQKERTQQWVLFWHIVGNSRVAYGPSTPPWYASFTDIISKGLNQREEQFFIRISAPAPVSEWWDTEIVQLLVRNLLRRNIAL